MLASLHGSMLLRSPISSIRYTLHNRCKRGRLQPANPTTRRSKRRRVVVGDEAESEVEIDVLHYGEDLDLDALLDMILHDI